MIGIQTSFQRDILKRFGTEAVCMDSTNGTNMYDFFLITILILDDLGEGGLDYMQLGRCCCDSTSFNENKREMWRYSYEDIYE